MGGPDVFLPDATAFATRKLMLANHHGFEGLSPALGQPAPSMDDASSERRIDALIFRANADLLGEADCGIFNLTPFRGVSADAGTVFELGMMIGLGKPVFGYTNDPADLLSRTRKAVAVAHDPASGSWRDADGMEVEDFGNADNLMIDRALAEQGRPIVRPAVAPQDPLRDLNGFEQCLRLAARAFAIPAA
ncbi:MAG: nucleoside 2-deoxyribosyltransferase [Rhodospirillales bacterium]